MYGVNTESLITLPIDLYPSTIECLNRLGAEFIGNVPEDNTCQYVLLPEGWSKVNTLGLLGYSLVDDKSRHRTGILSNLKLVFCNRYSFNWLWQTGLDEYGNYIEGYRGYVSDAIKGMEELFNPGPNIIYRTKYVCNDNDIEDVMHKKEALHMVKEWLDNKYPDWKDPLAYWD